MRLIKWALWGTAVIAAIVFSVINLDEVAVRLDPFGLVAPETATIRAPLAFVILASLTIGLALGIFLENDRGREKRVALSRKNRETRRLQADNERMHEALKAADNPESATLPAVRK